MTLNKIELYTLHKGKYQRQENSIEFKGMTFVELIKTESVVMDVHKLSKPFEGYTNK